MKKFALLLIPFLAFAACQKDDTEEPITPENPPSGPVDEHPGRLGGFFSVGADKQVYFSQGNLQYCATTAVWRFAEHQYDFVGDDNANAAADYEGWIDLFGFGTSGYGLTEPYASSDNYDEYCQEMYDIAGTDYDWGVYNAISNGGDEPGLWRTMTRDEWNYLVTGRPNAAQKVTFATVADVAGAILLPDDWALPEGCLFNPTIQNYTTNCYSAEQWAKMESAGAVFLPCAGVRMYYTMQLVGTGGYYWSSSYYNETYASFYSFQVGNFDLYDNFRIMCLSVRLVCDK